MPAKRRRSRRTSTATDTPSLEARFLTLKGGRLAQRLKDFSGPLGPRPGTVAKEKSIIDAFLEGFEKGKICGELEQTIESGINFLQENGNNPALQETCDNLRKEVVKTVGIYASNC